MPGHPGAPIGAPAHVAEHQPQFDFTEELQGALQHAPLVHLTESGAVVEELAHIWEQFEPVSTRPDSYFVYRKNRIMPNQVVTDNYDAYPFLLDQALAVVRGEPSPQGGPVRETAKEMAAHEFEHATAIHKTNPRPAIRYGVGIVRLIGTADQSRPVVGPFVRPVGWLRKIDFAFMAASPAKLSEEDLAVVHALGYTSPEEAMERYADLPPGRLSGLNLLNIISTGLGKPLWQASG
jgi:hypothetical protein